MKSFDMKTSLIPRHWYLLICCGLLFAGCSKEPAKRPLRRVDVPSYIGVTALQRVERLCALGPRNAMTQGGEKAAEWIVSELRASGLQPEIDVFDDPAPNGKSRFFRNVTAEVKGTGKGKVLLLSHYDTKSGISDSFVGANDGGSSTGLLLELADYIKKNPISQTVVFAFLDGEECVHDFTESDGLHGSTRLARKMRRKNETVDAVILLDMVGDKDLCLTLPRNGTTSLKTLVLDAAAVQGVRHKVKVATFDILDDHQPFLDNIYKAIDLIDFEYGSVPGARDYWHTDADTPDKLSAESLHNVAAIVLEMLSMLDM